MDLFIAEATVQGPLWAQIVYAVITAVIAAFLLPYLKNKSSAAAAEVKANFLAGTSDEITATSAVMAEIKLFLLERASCIAEKDFPIIAKNVLSGGLTVAGVKDALRGLGQNLKIEAIGYFMEHRGWDIMKLVGDQQLDRLIEYVANKVSPFPGKDSAVEFMKSDVSNWIVDRGVDAVRDRYSSGAADMADAAKSLIEALRENLPAAVPVDETSDADATDAANQGG